MSSQNKTIFLFLLLTVLMVVPLDAQCAMCRAALASDESSSTAEGVNDGIVYLMAIPYILVGGLFFMVYRKMKSVKD